MTNSDSPRPGSASQRITVRDESHARTSRVGTRRQTEKKTKPQKEKWVPPEGTLFPDRGWPKFLYALYRFLRVEKVPAINAAQRAELDYQAKLDYRDELIAREKYLGKDLGIPAIIAVANIKSATKSATTIGTSTEMAELTRKKTVILPMTSNTATATVGKMTGIVGNVVDIDKYIEDIKSYGDAWQMDSVPSTDAGLTVVAEGRSGAANDDDEDKVAKLVHAVDVSLNNVRLLFLDLGNDNIRRRRIALQAVRLAHVVICPFDITSPITEDSLRETLDGYSSDREIPEDIWRDLFANFQNIERTGIKRTTPQKIASSIVVATKADGPVDFAYYTRPVHQDANADGFMEWNGTGITVPFEPAWLEKNPRGGVMPYSRDRIKLETQIAYLEIGVAALELAGHQQGYNIGVPMVANIPELTHREEQEGGGAST